MQEYISPCLLKLIIKDETAAPIACKALVNTQNTPKNVLVVSNILENCTE